MTFTSLSHDHRTAIGTKQKPPYFLLEATHQCLSTPWLKKRPQPPIMVEKLTGVPSDILLFLYREDRWGSRVEVKIHGCHIS